MKYFNHFSGGLHRWIKVLIVGLMLPAGLCLGQQSTNATPASGSVKGSLMAVPPAAPSVDDRYRIGPGDLLSVTTLDYPQLSSDAIRVDSKGMILLPLVDGEIEAACHTEGELAQEITKRYLKYLKEPQVKVFVKEFQSQNVAVIGAVRAPGRFQLQRRVRLLELLTFVGGPADQAGRSIQIIHADASNTCGGAATDETAGSQLVSLDLSQTLRGEPTANPVVMAGDIITVPDADQYFMVGNVAKPSAYPLKDKTNITQAIAMAGGTLPDTKTDRVKILRQGAGSSGRTELIVDLKQATKKGADEVWLQPNDIIEVSKVGGMAMGFKNLVRTMVPSLTMLPMRVIY